MELEMSAAVAGAVVSSPFVTVDKCSDIVHVMATSTPGSENQANLALKRVKKSNNMKKRYRGKRKPKRKENRRRARPGRSRSGFRAMGAPFNNNEFLINQRDNVKKDEKQTNYMYERAYSGKDNREENFHHHEGDNCYHNNICSETICRCEAACCETERDSSRSADTSDYDSLHSPTESSSGSSNHWDDEHTRDDILNDELFDMDFAMQNFEAEYSAQQWKMKEQLETLPRQQLEMRCSLLMDQLKDLEERSRVMHGMDRIRELELELESLKEENRQLRGAAADSPVLE